MLCTLGKREATDVSDLEYPQSCLSYQFIMLALEYCNIVDIIALYKSFSQVVSWFLINEEESAHMKLGPVDIKVSTGSPTNQDELCTAHLLINVSK